MLHGKPRLVRINIRIDKCRHTEFLYILPGDALVGTDIRHLYQIVLLFLTQFRKPCDHTSCDHGLAKSHLVRYENTVAPALVEFDDPIDGLFLEVLQCRHCGFGDSLGIVSLTHGQSPSRDSDLMPSQNSRTSCCIWTGLHRRSLSCPGDSQPRGYALGFPPPQ